MSKHRQTLADLAALITRLKGELLEHERADLDLTGDETSRDQSTARLTEIRGVLELAKDAYIEESERLRTLPCPVHQPGVLIVGCAACQAAWAAREPAGRRAA